MSMIVRGSSLSMTKARYSTGTIEGTCKLGVVDEWMLNAPSVLCGDFNDRDSGNRAR